MIDTLLLRQDIAQLIEELHTTSNLSLEQIQFYIKKGDNETEYTVSDLWPIFVRNNEKISKNTDSNRWHWTDEEKPRWT